MKELVYGKRQKKILIPETWEEINSRQYIKIAGLLHRDNLSEEAQKDRLLHVVCGKSPYRFFFIPVEIRMNCYEHIQWILDAPGTTKQMIPVCDGLYGPEAEFNNLILSEFHHTEMAYERFVMDGESDGLDELVATLYREPKKGYDKKRNPEGDVRQPFSYSLMVWNKVKVKRWDLPVKLAVLIWYDTCREQFYGMYKPAFKGGKKKNLASGLYPLIRSLAGEKYGTFEASEKLNVHVAMMEIVSSIEEEAELKRKYPDLYK